MNSNPQNSRLITKSGFIAILVFGAAAFSIMAADLMIPVYGETIRIDPREIFVTLGAALTGPIGGFLIGFMAQSWFNNGDFSFQIISMLVHTTGGMWMGIAYKKLVYEKLKMPWMVLGWGSIIIIYYFLTLFFLFVTGSRFLFPTLYSELFNNLPIGQAYWGLATAAIPEFAMTLILTTIILIILPPKYRRPLW